MSTSHRQSQDLNLRVAEIHLNYIGKFSSYLTKIKLCLHDLLVMEIITYA
jgi:hypothetical protein